MFLPPAVRYVFIVAAPLNPQPNFVVCSCADSLRHLLWWTMQRLQSFSGLLFVDEIRRSRLIVWYYRLLGAKLGRDVFLNTVRVRGGERRHMFCQYCTWPCLLPHGFVSWCPLSTPVPCVYLRTHLRYFASVVAPSAPCLGLDLCILYLAG